MRAFFREISHALTAGQDVELVSILEAKGSTPRGAGAMMAVFPDGHTTGTVGGGNVEFASARMAGDLLDRRENAVHRFRFVPGDGASLGMVCGGDVTVHFQFLPAGDAHTLDVCEEIRAASGRNADTWLVRQIDPDGHVTAMGLADRSGTNLLPEGTVLPAGLLENGGRTVESWCASPVVRGGMLYIFGGGHVSQALVPAAAAVGFRPVVYDDRPEFASKQLFPQAERVLCGSFDAIGDHISITADDYVVVMTRGHQADYEVLTQVLRSGARYLGCIGSRRKLTLCRERLENAGFTDAEYARLHAPIGLAIGAETPAEIAVSVTAELIAVRAGLDNR